MIIAFVATIEVDFDGDPKEEDVAWYAKAVEQLISEHLEIGETRIDRRFRYAFVRASVADPRLLEPSRIK